MNIKSELMQKKKNSQYEIKAHSQPIIIHEVSNDVDNKKVILVM